MLLFHIQGNLPSSSDELEILWKKSRQFEVAPNVSVELVLLLFRQCLSKVERDTKLLQWAQ